MALLGDSLYKLPSFYIIIYSSHSLKCHGHIKDSNHFFFTKNMVTECKRAHSKTFLYVRKIPMRITISKSLKFTTLLLSFYRHKTFMSFITLHVHIYNFFFWIWFKDHIRMHSLIFFFSFYHENLKCKNKKKISTP